MDPTIEPITSLQQQVDRRLHDLKYALTGHDPQVAARAAYKYLVSKNKLDSRNRRAHEAERTR